MQDFCLDWGRTGRDTFTSAYIDPMDVPFMKDLQQGLEYIHPSEEELVQKLEDNLSLLENMAAETFRVVSAKLIGTPENMSVNPYHMSLKISKEELLLQSESEQALIANDSIASALSCLWLNEKITL